MVPSLSTDEMLERMSTLLFFNGVWYARTRNFSSKFAQGATPREALAAALETEKPAVANPMPVVAPDADQPNDDLF